MFSSMEQLPGVVQLDLHVRVSHIEEDALQILREIRPLWSAQDVKFKVFTAGYSNILRGCYVEDDTEWSDMVLVRVYGAKTELIIDRQLEIKNMILLHDVGCSRPLYCTFSNGIAYGFVQGACLDEHMVREEHIGRLVAKEMVKVNALDPVNLKQQLGDHFVQGISKEPLLFTKMQSYLDISPDSFPDPDKEARYKKEIKSKEELQQELDLLKEELEPLGSPSVFCHNDLLLENIVYNKDTDSCAFIDYEYGGFNYLAYEIGDHFCEWAGLNVVDYSLYPDKATQLKWLRNYLQEYKQFHNQDLTITDLEIEQLYVQVNKFALASHLFWGIWALIQARCSAIDFDFLLYSKQRLDEYFARKEEFLSLQMP